MIVAVVRLSRWLRGDSNDDKITDHYWTIRDQLHDVVEPYGPDIRTWVGGGFLYIEANDPWAEDVRAVQRTLYATFGEEKVRGATLEVYTHVKSEALVGVVDGA